MIPLVDSEQGLVVKIKIQNVPQEKDESKVSQAFASKNEKEASEKKEADAAKAKGIEEVLTERVVDVTRQQRSFTEAAAQGEVGLGVDIVELNRMQRILDRTPSFAKKVFSEDEQKYCFSKAKPAVHFATRFAAKEAVLKALGTGFSEGIGVRDIEVVRNAKGKPSVVLRGRAKEIADLYHVIDLPLSLSYTHQEAVACAMAITTESIQIAESRVDPMEELAKQFKDARSLLDEMEAKKPS